MDDRKFRVTQQPSRLEELNRAWDWVVYVVRMLSRVGGIRAWTRTFKTLGSMLLNRFRVQQKSQLNQSSHASSQPKQAFYSVADFAFAQLLEDNWQVVFNELEQLHGQYFIPWSEKYLYQQGWETFGLYAYGVKIEKNCNLCPETTKLLEQIPGLMTAAFSSLAPGTHIAPHTGYPDGVLRCHLGLVVPDDCAIRVGTETQSWRVGKCLIFDDTLEHSAWNRSDQTRVILLIDFRPPEGVLG